MKIEKKDQRKRRKGFLKILVFLVGICFAFNFTAQSHPLQMQSNSDEDGKFEIRADGKVNAGDKEFKNLSEYFKSEYFKKMGKRCKVKRLPGEYHPLESTDHCTLYQTVINDEYWPAQPYIIPIVFHIIHKVDGTGNIPDQRIYDQVEVLNEDYGAIAGTLGALGFDTKIQFQLAGITRTANNLWHLYAGLYELDYKFALGWNQDLFLNVYVNSADGDLGWAYLPQEAAGTVWDGVVLLYVCVGGRDMGYPPYDQGRTLVHEIGHYLGLFHTFEGEDCYEGYYAGDLIADTHSENTEHYGCTPTNTCGTPDDIHNYMNYTDDLCMLELTAEQANRAVCSLVNYRPQLPLELSITLTSPNGGETWPLGSTQKITWTSNGLTGTVKLILFKDGALIGTIAHGIDVTDGEFDWTVGNHSLGTASPGDGYVVRVKSIENKDIFDDSDAPFTISRLVLTSPNGGETWPQGPTQTICWDYSGITGTVKLVLFKDGTRIGTIASGIPVELGCYNWTVGNYIGGTASPGTGYVVRVKLIEDKIYWDDSDAPFTISGGCTLELTSPNGGETWALGSTQTITWTSPGVTGNVKLVLFKNGTRIGTIAAGIPVSAGSYPWTVGNYIGGTALPGTGYVVRVKSMEDKTCYDDSDAPFTISGLVLTYPKGGETWPLGSTQKITWASGGITGTVKLILFKDGALIGTIAHGIDVAVDEFDWTVGNHSLGTALPGPGYVVRVKLIEDKTYCDDSDGSFEISGPS